jgi:hypothetical protein
MPIVLFPSSFIRPSPSNRITSSIRCASFVGATNKGGFGKALPLGINASQPVTQIRASNGKAFRIFIVITNSPNGRWFETAVSRARYASLAAPFCGDGAS